MDADFDSLTRSLPQALHDGEGDRDSLAEFLRGLAKRPVPTSRLARLWSLGTTQVGMVVGSAFAWARGALSSEEKRLLIKNEAQLRSALKMLRTMGYLRGAVAKVGQTIAAYPNLGPEQLGDVLGALNFQAPPMHFSLLREQFANELGEDPERHFAKFETEAFAAASLGQVHRAHLPSGEPVAVKIQYPNIARTIRADLGALEGLMTPLRLTREWAFLRDQVRDIKSTFERETDYASEADYAERARKALADIDDIVVPRIHHELSTERVLTMDLLDGVHLDDLLATDPSQEVRDRHGAQVFRAMCRLFYSGQMIHADPNPGNFLFLPDGRLGLIDFGCCRVFSDEELDYFEQGTRDFLQEGSPSDAILQRGALMTDEEMRDDERVRTLRASVEWLWEPLAHDGPFAFDDAYMQRGLACLAEISKKRYTRTTPINTWSNRMFYGVRVLLHRLGACFNAKAIHDEEVQRARFGSRPNPAN